MTPEAARSEPEPENGQEHYLPRKDFQVVMTLCTDGEWEAEIHRRGHRQVVLLYGMDFHQVLTDAVEMVHGVP